MRAAVGGAGAAGIRLLFVVANALPFGGAGKTLAEPRLSSIALVTVAAGVLLGLKLASRRGERRDSFTAGIAGGLLGLLCSALGFSVLQSIERLLGTWSTSVVAVCLVWGIAGALLAVLSTIVIPHRRALDQEGS